MLSQMLSISMGTTNKISIDYATKKMRREIKNFIAKNQLNMREIGAPYRK